MTSKVTYQNPLRTTAVHLASNNSIITDAPLDNHGKGEAFSPTDLVATALASCLLTIMGIKSKDLGVDLSGTSAQVKKVMASQPRRISEIHIDVEFKLCTDTKTQRILERAALTCPVAQSLHTDLVQNIQFHWPV